jgi:hypothetical protein
MEPVETILVPISKAAGCTIICEAELSHDCTCRQTAHAAIEALEADGLCVVPKLGKAETEARERRAFDAGWTWHKRITDGPMWTDLSAAPTPSRTEEGDGW